MGELADRLAQGQDFEQAYASLFERHATLVSLGSFSLPVEKPVEEPVEETGLRAVHDYPIPETHVRRLVRASAGDVLIMKAAIPHHGYRYVLYEVAAVE